MKRKLLIVFSILLSGSLCAQSTILNFTIVPSSPTTADYVKVITGLQFNSGGCLVFQQGHSTVGLITDAIAIHCLGMLPYICNTTDTFNLGYLQSGDNLFRLSLSSGFFGPPCTPGIVPDDIDSISFNVSPVAGIHSPDPVSNEVNIYPNPICQSATIFITADLQFKNTEFKMMNVLGETVKTIENISANEINLDRGNLSKGIYFYQLTDNGIVMTTGKIIIE
jgi:hypothetical protein